MTPSQRSLRARMAAYAQHAQYDTRQTTAAARRSFLARFEAEVDPHGVLSPTERARRAEAARKAHFSRLALKSAQVRAARASNSAHSRAARSSAPA